MLITNSPSDQDQDCKHDKKELVRHDCANGTEARVHALVIGISRYEKKLRPGGGGFEQLPGASRGAIRFARYLEHEFNDPKGRRIGTIRLLVSPTRQEFEELGTLPYKPALTDDVADALQDWGDDCDRHPDNLAILYAAGHGIASVTGSSTLFLADAPRRKNRYQASVSLSSVASLMADCSARDNVYLFDCCALVDVPDLSLRGGLSLAEFPKADEGGKRSKRDTAIVISAARVGASTFAIDEDGTLLSRGLLGEYREHTGEDALLLTAGEIRADRYGITMERLEQDLPARLREIVEDLGGDTEGYAPSVTPLQRGPAHPITVPDPPPSFNVVLTGLHEKRTRPVSLLVRDGSGVILCTHADAPNEFRVPLPAGQMHIYVAGAGESIATPYPVSITGPSTVPVAP